MKDNLGLVAWAKQAHQKGWKYLYGGFFDRAVDRKYIDYKANQYPKQYTSSYINRTVKNALGKVAGDCVGLIKSYIWEINGKVTYRSKEDKSANGMFNLATVKGEINTIPEIPGLAVHYSGHVGVYIGNGEVIEARGVDYGVVKTKLKDRPWTYWYKIPFIDYGEDNMELTVLKRTSPIMINEDVKLFQRLANLKHNAGLVEDGQYGDLSESFCIIIQSIYGLKEDGICGKDTWNVLLYGNEKKLEDENASLSGSIASYKLEVSELKKDKDSLKRENTGLIAQIAEKQTEIANRNKEIASLTIRLAEKEGNLEDLYNLLILCQNENENLHNEIKKLEKENKDEIKEDLSLSDILSLFFSKLADLFRSK